MFSVKNILNLHNSNLMLVKYIWNGKDRLPQHCSPNLASPRAAVAVNHVHGLKGGGLGYFLRKRVILSY